MISRAPAVELQLDEAHLLVKCLEASRNSILFQDALVREARLEPGQAFWIGKTSFQFVDVSSSTPTPAEVRVFAEDELKTLAVRDSSQQIEALGEIPQ